MSPDVAAATDATFMQSIRRYAAFAHPAGGPGSSLSVGCGTAVYAERLAADGWDAHGIDVLERPGANGSATPAAAADELPFPDGCFDLVTAVELIEHLDPELAMACVDEVRRVLRPGGVAFFATPNHLDNAFWNVFTPGFTDPGRTRGNYQSVQSLRAALARFSACHVYGHTPSAGQFRAADALDALRGGGLDLPVVRSLALRAGRRAAWRLLGRDPVYAAYLHAVAIR